MPKKNDTRAIFAEVAGTVFAAGREWSAYHRRCWPKNTEADREMRRSGAKDSRDISGVARALRKGDVRDAYLRAVKLDTIVRDSLPNRFWTLTEAFYGE